MRRMIFIAGFARGGTSWLRDCVGFHPDVGVIPGEMVYFRDFRDKKAIEESIMNSTVEFGIEKRMIVNKAPANSRFLDVGCKMFPESKFLFIMRDPRDVLTSHQRGTKDWMGGRNSTAIGNSKKTRSYWKGYESVKRKKNVMLVKYEDLHQFFEKVLAEIYTFLGLPYDESFLIQAYNKLNFHAQTQRNHEDRGAHKRKGVIGEWAVHLNSEDQAFFLKDRFWKKFLKNHKYRITPLTYETIIKAILDAGFNPLGFHDNSPMRKEIANSLNMVVNHVVGLPFSQTDKDNLYKTAELEYSLGIGGVYYMDLHYPGGDQNLFSSKEFIRFCKGLMKRNPEAVFGIILDPYYCSEKHADQVLNLISDHRDDIVFKFWSHHSVVATGKMTETYSANSGENIRQLELSGLVHWESFVDDSIEKGGSSNQTIIFEQSGSVSVMGLDGDGDVDSPETYKIFKQGSLIQIFFNSGKIEPTEQPLTLGRRCRHLSN